MPSTYVKKNGVATRLVGIPKGWNVVNTFNVASTAWVANPDSTTSSTYPYVATISTTYFTNDSQPIWQMNGVGTLPTETEREAINLVMEAIFTSTGVTLYATDQPTVNLVLETGGFATSYASGTSSAADVSYSNTTSGLTATDARAAIDEVAGENVYSTAEKVIGKWIDGSPVYEKTYSGEGTFTSDITLDNTLTSLNTQVIDYRGSLFANNSYITFIDATIGGNRIRVEPYLDTAAKLIISGFTVQKYVVTIRYIKIA